MLRLNKTIQEIRDIEIISELYGTKRRMSEPFDDLSLSNLSIVMVEYALYKTLSSEGIYPDYVLGASLGEYVAATVAGVLNVDALLDAVSSLSDAINRKCTKGCMIAVMNDLRLYDRSAFLRNNSELAARNYSSHFVISASHESCHQILTYLKKRDVLYQKLDVNFAFHSSLVDAAKTEFLQHIHGLDKKTTVIPYMSSVTSDEVGMVGGEHLWDIIRCPIEFQATVKKLEEQQAFVFLDLGPSGSLANFVCHNLNQHSESVAMPLITPFGQSAQALDNIAMKFSDRYSSIAVKNRTDQNKKTKRKKQMITWVFPGQGSQCKGMGGGLWDRYPELITQADAIVGYSLEKLCMEDPHHQLDRTQFTQPALYVVNALSYLKKIDETGQKPDYLAGHSLGEYNALMASGCFDFETGLKLVQKRSALMGKATGGAMAAIINLSAEDVGAWLHDNELNSIDIANYNAPSQTVISGPADDIKKAAEIFKIRKVTCIMLRVSAAFHSRYMQTFLEEFNIFLQRFKFSNLQIPVISNVHAGPYLSSQIRENLTAQLTHSVQWTDSIRYLISQGPMEFEEIGPGRVLTNLIQRIKNESEPISNKKKSSFSESLLIEGNDYKKTNNEKGCQAAKVHPINRFQRRKKIDFDKNFSAPGKNMFSAESLGSDTFKRKYKLKYAYLSGAMFRGVASKEMVVSMGREGMMGSLGTGGMTLESIEKDIQWIKKKLNAGQPYAMNLLSNINDPDQEQLLVDLYLRSGVKIVEASAFMQITSALVHFRLSGLKHGNHGEIVADHKIIAKISRPEVAEAFLNPAPAPLVSKLLENGKISQDQAEMADLVPMADDLCVEADSGGHTDRGNLSVLLPAMIRLRNRLADKFSYKRDIHVGGAGGIGTPEAAAAAFLLGADFILTGSINQCTVEAGTSDVVKDLLQTINVQDTDYAPAADMFEYGAKVQVVRKGLFFPARANKLFDLYRRFNSLDEIDARTRKQIEERYFQRSFEEVYEGTKEYFLKRNPGEIQRAERNAKHKMALVFRWYLFNSIQLALQGTEAQKVDYQIHCGPALGAFNQWVDGTSIKEWRNRHVDRIGVRLMKETAQLLDDRLSRAFNYSGDSISSKDITPVQN